MAAEEPAGRRIGLLGGTFDPPHVAHLVVARDVLEALELDEMRLVVAADPPHKGELTSAPADTRARMLEACMEVVDDGRLRVSRIEMEREGPSWTVDTLRELHRRESGQEWFLVLGADQLSELSAWREPEEVARLARLVGVARGGRHPDEVEPGVDVPWVTVDVHRLDVSSTEIRRRIRRGRPVRWLVPEPALEIIRQEGLYVADGGER